MKQGILVLLVLLALPAFVLATPQQETGEAYSLPAGVEAKGTVTFWHAMSGSRGGVVEGLVADFNAEFPAINVDAVYSGSYAETVTKGLAAVKAGAPPVLLQSYEVGTQTMIDSGAIIPVFELNKGEVDMNDVVGPIKRYYSVGGRMYSMPFNSSTAMMYYNRDLFREAGFDPSQPPDTFDKVYQAGKKMVDTGIAQGGLSFGWPGWIFEQMFAYHDQLYANNDNGRGGKRATKVLFDTDFGAKVLEEWQKWSRDGVLFYGGREYKANAPFIAGQFGMLMQSTSSLAGTIKKVEFDMGTAFLPRMPGYGKGNSVIGGGSLWLMKGHSDEVNAAAWEFLQFLFRTENAITWHKGTGYFPVNYKALAVLEKEGWFEQDPRFRTAFDQILSGNETAAGTGVLLGNFVQIRDIVQTSIEEVVVNMADPKATLEATKAKCDQVLADYLATVE